MLHKSNEKSRHKEKMLLTADVAEALQNLNNQTNWRNQSGKMNLTRTLKTHEKNTLGGNNMMTEDQIDELFSKGPKIKAITEQTQNWGQNENRNFLNSVKFLHLPDEYDKLIGGMAQKQYVVETKLEQCFGKENNKQDLTQKFKKNFLVGKVIGEGAYASVRVAVYKPLNKKVAIKVYEKRKIKEPQRKKAVRRQICILQALNHPNVVKIYDVVETNNHLNIVMEFLGGIPLNKYLKSQQGNKIAEKSCRKIIRGLAQGLKYLHEKRISHRDIKMENVILDENLTPKLIDFGFSTCIQSNKKVKLFCGTPSYMAPEIVQKKQYRGQQAEIWALGVLLFVCLTGIFPFRGSSDQELYTRINRVDYPKGELLSSSKQATQLISKMLKYNPEERITANQILYHPWIRSFTQNCNSSMKKKSKSKSKRLDSSSIDFKKRMTTMSSHKSKESWANKQIKKLNQTYKENLKNEIKVAKQSPLSHSKKYGQGLRKDDKSTQQIGNYRQGQEDPSLKRAKVVKQKKNLTTDLRILDILRTEMRKREEKSKSRNHR